MQIPSIQLKKKQPFSHNSIGDRPKYMHIRYPGVFKNKAENV